MMPPCRRQCMPTRTFSTALICAKSLMFWNVRPTPRAVIACGGIHTPDDARDFLEAGAKAVQLDSVVWIRPDLVEIIARNLGGIEMTRMAGALADEWQPGLSATAALRIPPIASPPPRPVK